MDKFLSCDWGTSSFRLRLVQANDLKVIAEENNGQGIADTYKLWQQQNENSASRLNFYKSVIKNQLQSLGQKLNISLDAIPVILSGMASSTIGMIDLPYKELPFNLDGSDLEVRFLDAKETYNQFIIISGARTDNDVMRGEETKIVGCISSLADAEQEQLLILPGTHPKHIVIKNNKAVSFKTFMTGEFFDLLSTQSVLSASVKKGGYFNDPANQQSFSDGVKASQTSDLLHASFMVRTNQVLKNVSKQQNFYYLSGLLIGTELKGLKRNIPIYLVGDAALISYYIAACNALNITLSKQIDADFALIKGQQTIFSQYYSISN